MVHQIQPWPTVTFINKEVESPWSNVPAPRGLHCRWFHTKPHGDFIFLWHFNCGFLNRQVCQRNLKKTHRASAARQLASTISTKDYFPHHHPYTHQWQLSQTPAVRRFNPDLGSSLGLWGDLGSGWRCGEEGEDLRLLVAGDIPTSSRSPGARCAAGWAGAQQCCPPRPSPGLLLARCCGRPGVASSPSFLCFPPLPQDHLDPLWGSGQGWHGRGHCPQSLSPALGPSGQVGEVEASLLPCSALQLLVGVSQVQGTPEGAGVCFAVVDALSSTEGRAKQLWGSAGTSSVWPWQGQHPWKACRGAHPLPTGAGVNPRSLPCRSGQCGGSGQPLREGLQPADGRPGARAGAADGDSLRAPCRRALLHLRRGRPAPLQAPDLQLVQRDPCWAGPPRRRHGRLPLPPASHLVAGGPGRPTRDHPAGPGNRLLLHPLDFGLQVTPAGRHGAGALPGLRRDVEALQILCC